MNLLKWFGITILAPALMIGTASAESFLSGDLPRKDDRALEEIPGVDSHYGVVDAPDGARLRTIVSVPAGTTDPMPALIFTQWVSCGSIEYRAGVPSREILARLARESGMALIRVERTANGDSIGPACDQLDFDTEFEHYRLAFKALLSDPRVDASTVVIHGSSLGSVTAPLMAEALEADGIDVDGIMIQGGGGVTYLERMINFDRINLGRRSDVDPASLHSEMQDRIRFHHEYLVRGRHPDEIAKDSEAMARVRNSTLGLAEKDHYGRPFAWHQQIARRNILKAWHAVDAKVLVVFNEFDQFEVRHGHRMIVDMVNRWRPGDATYIEEKNIGHSNMLFTDIDDAYANIVGTPETAPVAAGDRLSSAMLLWLRDNGFVVVK